MSTNNHLPNPNEERFVDLMIANATLGLDESELSELEQLALYSNNSNEPERFEQVVAAIDLAQMPVENEMPADVRDLLLVSAGKFFSDDAEIPGQESRHADPNPTPKVDLSSSDTNRMRLREAFAYAIAAAACLFLLTGYNPLGIKQDPAVAQRMQRFVDSRPDDLVRADWQAVHVKDVSGEVIWSDDKQEGFMVFENLPINDPTNEQYQLWIFDTDREQKVPVDGGVFDIESNGRVVVPIKAHVPVSKAVQFAVTVEKPGGVMQSKREKIPVLGVVE